MYINKVRLFQIRWYFELSKYGFIFFQKMQRKLYGIMQNIFKSIILSGYMVIAL